MVNNLTCRPLSRGVVILQHPANLFAETYLYPCEHNNYVQLLVNYTTEPTESTRCELDRAIQQTSWSNDTPWNIAYIFNAWGYQPPPVLIEFLFQYVA